MGVRDKYFKLPHLSEVLAWNRVTKFVHLHLHSEWSVLDSCIRLKDLIPRAKELGFQALAVTDHGVMSGALAFYQAAREGGIRLIIGCEAYLAADHLKRSGAIYHLGLLARDLVGYHNLMRLVSIASLAWTASTRNRASTWVSCSASTRGLWRSPAASRARCRRPC